MGVHVTGGLPSTWDRRRDHAVAGAPVAVAIVTRTRSTSTERLMGSGHGTGAGGGYLLDNREEAAAARLAAMATLFDPWSCRHLEQLGVGPGWRCWEVGAGAGSLVRWLSARVGPDGGVLATDIELARLDGLPANVEVRRHDVATDAPPGAAFDLVHARLVLVHVPDRHRALEVMAASLRPGGWLVVEDADPALQPLSCLDPRSAAEEQANRIRSGFRALLASRGADLAYARRLPRLLRDAGLEEVAADAYFPVSSPACRDLEIATVTLVRDQMVAGGVATGAEIDDHVAHVASGAFDLAQPPLVTAWGRRPGGA